MQKLWLGWLLLGLVACGDTNRHPEENPSAKAAAEVVPASDTVVPVVSVDQTPTEDAVEPIIQTNEAGRSGSESDQSAIALKRPALNELTTEVPRGLLPAGVTPLSYALELTVLPDEDRFSGHVDIAVALSHPTNHIFLHGQSLDVTEAVAIMPDGKTVNATYTQVHDDGVVKLEFARVVEAGNIVLEFDYSAPFGRRLHGLYTVSSGDNSYAFTQMASVYAREAFPSFDEPAFKTPFELTLIVDQSHEAIANTPQTDLQITEGGLKRVRFAPSPPMPAYLFAIAVGPFDIVDAGDIQPNSVRTEPLPFRGVTVKGKGDDLAYAMEETGKILRVLEEYFDSPYPFAKLDVIAVPDFEGGAMENSGAITFRDKLLLLGEDAPPQQKRLYAFVMAHELAHMWFGNLVTMPWWDDIWLNESFATWMAFKAVESYRPTDNPYAMSLKYSSDAMREDSLLSARQIREPVQNNDDIVAAFDSITYAKGGAVLTMLEQFIGEDDFRKGIRAHLHTFANGSASVHELLASLSDVSGQELAPAANTFLFQNGVPLVDVTRNCDTGTLQVTQSRYLPLGSEKGEERLWQIPMCIRLGYDEHVEERCFLMDQESREISVANKCPNWVLPNADFSGYYHWMLPQDDYPGLLAAGAELNEREWLSIADSVRAGFASGRMNMAETWALIEQLATSGYPSVARSLLPVIHYIEGTLADDPKLRWTIRGRAADLYRHLDAQRAFDADFLKSLPDNETRIYYSDVASFMAETAYDQTSRSAALVKARAFMSDTDSARSVSRSTLDTILTIGVQDGGQRFVDALEARFLASEDGWFRDIALSALARSRDPAYGEKLRNLSLTGELRSNEIGRLFGSHTEEDVNVGPAWEWLKSNIDQLIDVMPERDAAKLADIAERLCDLHFEPELEALLRSRLSRLPGGDRRLTIALERLRVCAGSALVQRPQVRAFFSLDGHRR